MNKSATRLAIVSIVIIVIVSIITAGLALVLNMTESSYSSLLSEFNDISNEYENLLSKYINLVQEYDKLAESYHWLDLPLQHKRSPSITMLKLWLQRDKTDEYAYDDPDFSCFHYSVTLMLHGRAQHYDIGVVLIRGHDNITGEDFSHCINAIITSEGLVYIEPQLDEVWWFDGYLEIINGTTYTFAVAENSIYVEETTILFDY